MNITTAPNEKSRPHSGLVDSWLADVKSANPDLVRKYLKVHGLEELPAPRYVNADMAVMWERVGDGYSETVRNATPHGIVTALEKGLLLAPPSERPEKVREEVDAEVEDQEARGEMSGETESVSENEHVLQCGYCRMEFRTFDNEGKPIRGAKARFTRHVNRHER